MSETAFGVKIFSSDQIRKWDAFTIEKEPVHSVELMERASRTFVDAFCALYSPDRPVVVFCGVGNNGGDGLVISRLLREKKYELTSYIVEYGGQRSSDFEYQLNATEAVKYLTVANEFPLFSSRTVVIDAIFGSGLNKPITGWLVEAIQKINESNCEIVAVDIASGLFASEPSQSQIIVQATHTFTFQTPKLAFLFPENHRFVGQLSILDIGLNPEFAVSEPSDYVLLQKENIAFILKRRPKFAHKGTFGHVFLFAGSRGKMGAAILASQAALRTGCGLLSVLVEDRNVPIMQTSVWEAMCFIYHENGPVFNITAEEKYTVGIGPGIGQETQALAILKRLLETTSKPVLIDADGLNLLALHPLLRASLPAQSVLTPHPKEFERLVGKWSNDFERLEKQKAFSKDHKVFVVLKGANSSITTPEGKVYFNSTGNPGMAKGGSGDVLSGIIVSLLAQNYDPEIATLLGVFLHGMAGDLAAEELGQESMLPRDIVDKIPEAFAALKRST